MNPFSTIHVADIFLHERRFNKLQEEEGERAGRGGARESGQRETGDRASLGKRLQAAGKRLAVGWMKKTFLL